MPPREQKSYPASEKRRAIYRPIGALRFLLALMVAIQHGGAHLLSPEYQEHFRAAGLGVLAVYIFFIISGFVVAEANHTFYATRPGSFLLNRVLRLVPPYLAALVIEIASAAYLYHLGRFHPWDYQLIGSPLQPRVLLSGIFCIIPFVHSRVISGQDFEFFAFIWSIRIEFTFYIAAALIYWIMQNKRLPDRLRRFVGIAAFIGGYALFFVWLLLPNLPDQGSLIPLFLIGVSCLLLWQKRGWRDGLLLGFGILCLLPDFLLWKAHDPDMAPYRLIVLLALVALFLTLILLPRVVDQRWKRIDVFLGNLSYPLYLNHYAVLLTLSNLFPDYFGLPLCVIGVTLSLLLALAMHRIVEAPMRGLRDHVRGTTL